MRVGRMQERRRERERRKNTVSGRQDYFVLIHFSVQIRSAQTYDWIYRCFAIPSHMTFPS